MNACSGARLAVETGAPASVLALPNQRWSLEAFASSRDLWQADLVLPSRVTADGLLEPGLLELIVAFSR